MRARLLAFVERLRERGVDVSLAEALDGMRAVAAAGVERPLLREALAAALVKEETDRPAFDVLFDEMFPAMGPRPAGRRRSAARGGAAAPTVGRGGPGDGGAGRPSTPDDAAPTASVPSSPRAANESAPRIGDKREAAEAARRTGDEQEATEKTPAERRTSRAARRRELMTLPFHAFTAREVEEARVLVRELGRRLRGRLARRERAGRRGRLDFRRTIRSAMSTGGVPVRPRLRARRPGRPDLVALCDLSGSVASASELLLGLVAPAADYFRRVHLFAYVDRLCPVSVERGHVAPGGALDLYARSDFGRVLADLWEDERDVLTRTTLVLVLGDARNNRRPPRADLLRAVRERVQRLVWLVPEPRARWDTGDSVLGRYAPACDAVVECLDLATLIEEVTRGLRAGPSG